MLASADAANVVLTSDPIPGPSAGWRSSPRFSPATTSPSLKVFRSAAGPWTCRSAPGATTPPGVSRPSRSSLGVADARGGDRLPYPRVGPLVLSEAAGGESSTAPRHLPTRGPGRIRQVALHAAPPGGARWISDQLAADRWTREGLASHYAALVAGGWASSLTTMPRACERAGGGRRAAIDWVGRAASRSRRNDTPRPGRVVEQIAGAVGEPRLTLVLRRVVRAVGL